MESLFKRLFLYRSTAKRRAWEDWLTESFAAVLDHNPRLRAAYAGHLIGLHVETADIETQRTFPIRARPDMWIDARDSDGGRHVVMVEHKTGRKLEKDLQQLRDYARCLAAQTETETKTLVLVARAPKKPDLEPCEGVTFRHLRWFEVCRWLRDQAELRRRNGEGTAFLDELLKFMKERGMTIEIDEEELAAYTLCKASRVEQRLEQLLEAAWEDCGMTAALGDTVGRRRRPNKKSIYWVSPRIVRHNAKVIYGYSYRRNDPEWRADGRRMPSAYVGISKPKSGGACKLPCPSGWKEPPQTWPNSYVWACEIGEQHLRGGPPSASYLEFFTGAFTALKAVLARTMVPRRLMLPD